MTAPHRRPGQAAGEAHREGPLARRRCSQKAGVARERPPREQDGGAEGRREASRQRGRRELSPAGRRRNGFGGSLAVTIGDLRALRSDEPFLDRRLALPTRLGDELRSYRSPDLCERRIGVTRLLAVRDQPGEDLGRDTAARQALVEVGADSPVMWIREAPFEENGERLGVRTPARTPPGTGDDVEVVARVALLWRLRTVARRLLVGAVGVVVTCHRRDTPARPA